MIRNIMRSAAVVALLTSGMAGRFVRAAEGPTSPSNSRESIGVPVGHRQPRTEKKPPNVLQDKGRRTEGQIQFDKTLTICRGC
jgi:hypothetical protein